MTTDLLHSLAQAGALRTLDHALARTLARLDPDTPDSVLAAAALASLAVASGHAGFDLREPQRLVDADIDWPAPDAWRAALAASRWVTCPDAGDIESAADAPLVLEAVGAAPALLYLRRYREYERRLAAGLHRIGAHASDASGIGALAPLFAQLFEADSAPIPTLTGPAQRSGRSEGPRGSAAQADLPHPPQAGQGLESRDAPDLFAPASVPANPDVSPTSSTSPARGGGRAESAGESARGEDLQARAAALALRHSLLLITGGPGTGKTTTTARLLVLLVAQALQAGKPAPRIALAAPTGRAAERMAESVRNAVQALAANGLDVALLAPLPAGGTTLHRLLGTIPNAPEFRHHADNPLPFDVVVVDEASMIDLPLMTKLVEAIADGARLVLLGDPDQLPSVEAGDVLSSILRAAGDGESIAGEDAAALRPLLAFDRHPREGGDPWTLRDPTQMSMGSRLRGSDEQRGTPVVPTFPARRIHLQRGYRQHDSLQLAPLAAAVRAGDTATTLSLLRGDTLAGVHFHEALADPLQAHRERLLAHWSALADASDPATALALANRLRILTAVRDGPQGARVLNARIEALLLERTRSAPGQGGGRRGAAAGSHFHGRLLLITENSARHRLFNGDIGIVLADAQNVLTAWFPGDDPAHPRPFHPAALPAYDSAFAMTVHKAQGSEFDAVWLLLPERFNRVLSRELVYTGITRARCELHVAGNAAVIGDALARHARRWSGLAWRLEAR